MYLLYHDAFHLAKLYIKSEIQQKNHQTKNAHPILNLFFFNIINKSVTIKEQEPRNKFMEKYRL